MRSRGAVGWWIVYLVSLLAYQAAASSRLLQGRGKGRHHNIRCCPQGCRYSCNGGGGGGSTTSAYAFISSQPELSAAKLLIDETGLRPVLEAPYANTLFVPTNAALEAYAARITANVTWGTDIGHGFLKLFFTKVLQYHTITGSYSATALAPGNYGTLYVSNNGMPHRVTKSSGNSLVDEQGNTIGISGPSQAVLGGGYVHVVSAVLEANDIFPSLTEALALDQFSQLRAVIQKIENTAPNPPLTSLLEGVSGTFALPNNQAFEGLNVADIDAKTLLDVVTYHLCPFKRMYRLLYTPFTVGKKPGKNPCLPVFSRAYNFPYGLRYTFYSPSNITITFATGSFPDALVAEDADIVFADISIPTQSAHVISNLILPPANVTAAGARASSRSEGTPPVLTVLQCLSTSSKCKQQDPNTGGRGWTAEDDVDDRSPGATNMPANVGGGSGNGGNGNADVRGARAMSALDSLIAVEDRSNSNTDGPFNKATEPEQGLQQQQQQPTTSRPTARRPRDRQKREKGEAEEEKKNNVMNPNILTALQPGRPSCSTTTTSSSRSRRRRRCSDNQPADGTPGSSAVASDTAGSVTQAAISGLPGSSDVLSIARRP